MLLPTHLSETLWDLEKYDTDFKNFRSPFCKWRNSIHWVQCTVWDKHLFQICSHFVYILNQTTLIFSISFHRSLSIFLIIFIIRLWIILFFLLYVFFKMWWPALPAVFKTREPSVICVMALGPFQYCFASQSLCMHTFCITVHDYLRNWEVLKKWLEFWRRCS